MFYKIRLAGVLLISDLLPMLTPSASIAENRCYRHGIRFLKTLSQSVRRFKRVDNSATIPFVKLLEKTVSFNGCKVNLQFIVVEKKGSNCCHAKGYGT